MQNSKLQFKIKKFGRGFTLIELLIAISIIGILSSFLLANFIGVRQRARDGVRKSDLRQIQSALELYRSDKGSYPSSLYPSSGNQCGVAFQESSSPPVVYMQKLPCDPSTGSIYTYTVSSPCTASYCVTACLENKNDSQLNNPITLCSGSTTTWQYTLQNP